MKKILTILTMSMLCSSLFGQIEKGSLLLDGNFQLLNRFVEPNNAFGIGIDAGLGIFLSDKFAIGSGIRSNYFNEGELSASNLTIAPFGRFYLINKESPWKWFLEAGTGIYLGFGDNNNDPVYSYNAGTGVNYFLNSQVALEGILQYINQDVENSRNTNQLVFNMRVRLFLNPNQEDENTGVNIVKDNSFFIGASVMSLDISTLLDDPNLFGINLNPNIGFFLSENWAIGAELILAHQTTDFYRGTTFGINPLVRFYPQSNPGRLQWFLYASGGINRSINKFEEGFGFPPAVDQSFWVKNFRSGIGLDLFLSENLAVEGTAGFNYFDGTPISNSERILSLDVSFQYFIR